MRSIQCNVRRHCRHPLQWRMFCSQNSNAIARIRNIGVCAHIDAGKTTTTERLLFYAGKIRAPGNVDAGSTTTDFLPDERERGITIKAAAITFEWRKHRVNLIDTPGHVDFTIEVEQALRVLDGAIIVVDAVKGVEAQTETVWRQADRYSVPRIVFVNKMDREGVDFLKAVQSLHSRLRATPLIVQLPLLDQYGSNFTGIIDLVHMNIYQWNLKDDTLGIQFAKSQLSNDHHLYLAAVEQRLQLLTMLADLDDAFAEILLEADAHTSIAVDDIVAALRRITLASKACPVLCGASLRNVAIQPLMDAVVDYLPSPLDKPVLKAKTLEGTDLTVNCDPNTKAPLVALAFKVNHDPGRGHAPVVFIRVYSGVLREREQLINVWQALQSRDRPTLGRTDFYERPSRLQLVEADKTTDVKEISAGNIGALIGMKITRTGDTLNKASARNPIYLQGIVTPEPVFFASIEAPSLSKQKELRDALACIEREDPSLQIEFDEESGQTLIKGMGELHIEIVHSRIRKEFNIAAELGPMRVSYRETATSSAEAEHELKATDFGSAGGEAYIAIRVEPREANTGNNIVFSSSVDRGSDSSQNHSSSLPLSEELKKSISTALLDGLNRGPLLGYPVVDVLIEVVQVNVTPLSSAPTFRAAAALCLHKALRECHASLLEPIMHTTVSVATNTVGDVLNDLTSRRRADIREIIPDSGGRSDIDCYVPLSEMIGYATVLRSRTAGGGSFSMEFFHTNLLVLIFNENCLTVHLSMKSFGDCSCKVAKLVSLKNCNDIHSNNDS